MQHPIKSEERANETRETAGSRSDRELPRERSKDSGIERRRFLRWPVFWRATLDDNDRAENCLVLDFSPGGAKLRCDNRPSVGSMVALRFPGAIEFIGKLVWRHGSVLGLEFREDARQCAELVEGILADRAAAS